MPITIRKIARFQVQLEEVQQHLDNLQKVSNQITPEQMCNLMDSFRLTCTSFKDCLEDLAIYVSRNEQKR